MRHEQSRLVLGRRRCGEIQSVTIAWSTRVSPDNVEWLESLPINSAPKVLVVHGGWSDPIDEYLKWTDTYFADIPGNRFASGRAYSGHLRWRQDVLQSRFRGQPRDRIRSAFATYDGEFTLHRIEYDPNRCSIC
jgi:hypothetical protein